MIGVCMCVSYGIGILSNQMLLLVVDLTAYMIGYYLLTIVEKKSYHSKKQKRYIYTYIHVLLYIIPFINTNTQFLIIII